MSTKTKILVGVVGLLLIALLWKFYPNIQNYQSNIAKSLAVDSTATSTGGDIPNATIVTKGASCEPPFSYTVVEEGERYGVIEVGAKGFNAFAIIKNGVNYNVLYKEFNNSNAYEGFASFEDVNNGIKKYLDNIGKQGVAGNNTHFVISSGAMKNPKTTLIAKALRKKGFVVNTVTAEEEGKYAYKAQIPAGYEDSSISVDIGSGNTKITYKENGKLISKETYGAKYLQNNVTDKTVYNNVASIVSSIPEQYLENVFIIGGVPYEMAQLTCTDTRYISFEKPEFYSTMEGKDPRFQSGVNIYSAIYNTAKPSKVVYDYDTNFTIGFLNSLRK